MVKEREKRFETSDGFSLFGKVWEPDEAPRAHLAFVHGFDDRCEIHGPLFPTLASSPFFIQCHSYDQRGWGKSAALPKHRGDSGPTSQVLQDIHEFVKQVASSIPDISATPLFLMGHSMGGQETLHYMLTNNDALLKDRPRISGYVAVAPYIALDPSSEPSSLLVFAGKIAAKLMPKTQMKQQLDHELISRNAEYNLSWKNDPLCPKTGTFEGMAGMLQRAADLNQLSKASNPVPQGLNTELPVPSLWLHGENDKICAIHATKDLFARLAGPNPDSVPNGIEPKTFKAYENAYHKLQWEPDGLGEQFSRDVATWVIQVVEAQKAHGSDAAARPRL